MLNSVVSVATEMAHASEIGPTPGIFRFTRTGDLNTPLSASFKIAGTAASGTDYLLLDKVAQFEAGSDSAFVSILPRNDGVVEGDETVALTVLPGTGYTLSTATSATVTIDRDTLPAAPGIYDSADSVQPDITYLDAQILNGQLQVSISLKNVSPFSFSNVEVFVDADQNPATGDYRTGHVGGASIASPPRPASSTMSRSGNSPPHPTRQTRCRSVTIPQLQGNTLILTVPVSELGNPAAVDLFACTHDDLNIAGSGDRAPNYGELDTRTRQVVVRKPCVTRIVTVTDPLGDNTGGRDLVSARFAAIADQYSIDLTFSQTVDPTSPQFSYPVEGNITLDSDRDLMTGSISMGGKVATWGGDQYLSFYLDKLMPQMILQPDPSGAIIYFGGDSNDGRWLPKGNTLSLSASLSTFDPVVMVTGDAGSQITRISSDGRMIAQVNVTSNTFTVVDALPGQGKAVDTGTGAILNPIAWDPSLTVSGSDALEFGGATSGDDLTRVDSEVVGNNLVVRGVLSTWLNTDCDNLFEILLDTDMNAATGERVTSDSGTAIGADYKVLVYDVDGLAMSYYADLVDRTGQSTVHDAWLRVETSSQFGVPGSFTVTIPLKALPGVGPSVRMLATTSRPGWIYRTDVAPTAPLVVKTNSPANLPPTVVTPASAMPSPVTGTTTTLSVLGADDGGEANLTYTWAATTLPSGAAAPTFSVNGTNAAKQTMATFSKAGTYGFTVTIADAGGLTTTSSVNVVVNQTLDQHRRQPRVGHRQGRRHPAVRGHGQGPVRQRAGHPAEFHLGRHRRHDHHRWSVYCSDNDRQCHRHGHERLVQGQRHCECHKLGLESPGPGVGEPRSEPGRRRLDQPAGHDPDPPQRGSDDGVVDATEFADLKTILNKAATLNIPGYVQVLAGDVVNGNAANAHFQGQALGNLAAGSSASQLNKLVDKWFLGADHPAAYATTSMACTISTRLGRRLAVRNARRTPTSTRANWATAISFPRWARWPTATRPPSRTCSSTTATAR